MSPRYFKSLNSQKPRKSFSILLFRLWKVIRSFSGLFFGITITYALYYLFTTQFKVNPITAKWIFTVLGIPLLFGCSFSPDFRCTILLFLPHFFSKRGRTALLAFAFALSLTGPTKNIALNMEILGHSLNCAEDELKEAMSAVMTIVKAPIVAIKQAITNILRQIRKVMQRVKEAVMKIVKILYLITNSIRKAFKWLQKIVNVCNAKVGSPFQRCQNAFKESFETCR